MVRVWFSACALVLVGFGAFDPRPAQAQGPSLGGYGAASSMASSGMGGSGAIIPYGGSLSGFMPYRMGGAGSGLSFSARSSSPMGPGRSSFSLSSMRSGVSMPSSALGNRLGRRSSGSLFASGMGGGMSRSMDRGSDSVMPPNFGYPFYQSPFLFSSSSSFMGMSSM